MVFLFPRILFLKFQIRTLKFFPFCVIFAIDCFADDHTDQYETQNIFCHLTNLNVRSENCFPLHNFSILAGHDDCFEMAGKFLALFKSQEEVLLVSDRGAQI